MRKITPLLCLSSLMIFALVFTAHHGQAQDKVFGIIEHFTDGDSFILKGQKVRLWGIDAPEYYQNCRDAAGKEYQCGREARRYFEQLALSQPVSCEIMPAAKRESRLVAKCFLDGVDLGGLIVRAGHAIDYTYFSDGFYKSEERAAKTVKKGLWQGAFMEPYHWRKRNKR